MSGLVVYPLTHPKPYLGGLKFHDDNIALGFWGFTLIKESAVISGSMRELAGIINSGRVNIPFLDIG